MDSHRDPVAASRLPLARCCTVALLAMMLSAVPAAAQTTADIVGRVTDASRSVLPGVTVSIENEGTGDARTAPTNATGDYAFNLLPPGTYTVTMELDGFNAETRRVTLSSGDRARLDARLELGGVTETVTVAAEAPLLQTETSTVSALVDDRLVQDLPVNGRNFVELVQTVPGANPGLPNSLASGTRPDDRRNTSAISVNGAQDNQNNHLIDGMDNNERQIGTIGVKPSIEAIAEVRVQTNNYTAEVGRTAGGVINVITKSGANVFSCSLFGYLRSDRFDSQDFFAATRPTLEQYQAGGSIGGPDRPESDVLLRGFRELRPHVGCDERDHRADDGDAQRRLLRASRADPRPADAPAVPRQPDPGEPHVADCPDADRSVPRAHRCGPVGQLRQRDRPHAGHQDGKTSASTIASTATTGCSCGIPGTT